MSEKSTERILDEIDELIGKDDSLNARRKNLRLGKRLLELLPQGPESGLDADTVDGLHVDEIIKKAHVLIGGGGGATPYTLEIHGNEYHDPDFLPLSGGTMTDDLSLLAGKKLIFKGVSYDAWIRLDEALWALILEDEYGDPMDLYAYWLYALRFFCDDIREKTLNAGVEVDGVLCKDGVLEDSAYPNALLLDGTRAIEKTVYYDEEYNNGDSGASKTIDWGNGNKQKITLTANSTLTFTNPSGPCNIVLKVVQDGTGSRTVTWDGDVKWSGGAPTLSTGAGDIDILTFYFDGTNYYGAFLGDFS